MIDSKVGQCSECLENPFLVLSPGESRPAENDPRTFVLGPAKAMKRDAGRFYSCRRFCRYFSCRLS